MPPWSHRARLPVSRVTCLAVLLVEPGVEEGLGKGQLPHDALVRDAPLLQELLNLLLGIVPGESLLIAASQVLERALAVQLGDSERGLLVYETLGNEIFARHGRGLLSRSNGIWVRTAQNSRQILPKWAPDSSYRKASAISANPKLRSITGWRSIASRARTKSICWLRLPTISPSSRACLAIRAPVGTSPARPVSTPISAMCPPTFTAAIDWASVPGPPTSTTWSTPRPPVQSRARRPQSSYWR